MWQSRAKMTEMDNAFRDVNLKVMYGRWQVDKGRDANVKDLSFEEYAKILGETLTSEDKAMIADYAKNTVAVESVEEVD